jgi:hypothetical protein
MRPLVIRTFVARLALFVSSAAEEIQLKDGSKISGELTGVTNDFFQIKTS